MSTVMVKTACGVCGTESSQREPARATQLGPPDLDLRPAETARSTMPFWLQQCGHCGYVAPSVAKADPAEVAVVGSGPYRSLMADGSLPPLARRFLLRAMILEETGRLHSAAEETLHAAWVADDSRKAELARAWRRDAVALMRSGPKLEIEQQVRVVDILRRAGDFIAAEEQAARLDAAALADPVDKVLAFERQLIARGDSRGYTVAAVLPPPSARPHVSQRGPSGAQAAPRPAAGGFWMALRRLFGRR